MPLELQAKILRVLQEKEIERIGGKHIIRIDIRIIAATNRDLLKEVSAGNFRSDLFYRLNVFPIDLPPLRERREDIPLLAKHFLDKAAKKLHKNIDEISDTSLDDMLTYNWPGNVRELEHVIERAVILSQGRILNLFMAGTRDASTDGKMVSAARIKTLRELETEHILAVLGHCNGKIRGEDGAAKILDIKPTTLESRMKKWGIKKEFVLSDG